jgi:hypothetical protein
MFFSSSASIALLLSVPNLKRSSADLLDAEDYCISTKNMSPAKEFSVFKLFKTMRHAAD